MKTGTQGKPDVSELISVIDLAKQLGVIKQRIFKVMKRLGVESVRQRNSTSRGQVSAHLTVQDAKRVSAYLRENTTTSFSEDSAVESDLVLSERGVFYLLQMEPETDPGRFKVGFATSLAERLRAHRCAAPFVTEVATWPCKRLWEKTAIECVTQGCERLHTEVFRAESLDNVRSRCDRFFELMPKLNGAGGR